MESHRGIFLGGVSMDLAGRRALVTGGSSGIGKACAIALARHGARVAVAARRRDQVDETVARIAAAEGPEGNPSGPSAARAVVADLSLDRERARCVEEAAAFLGGIDVLVNAAGILEGGTVETTTLEAWDRTMEINVRSIFHLTQLALPHLIASRGCIVNLSSVAGIRAYPGVLSYCVSKAAVDQMTRCLSLELAPRGIRVNAVNPGVVVTNLHRAGGMAAADYAGFLERSKTTHPMGRTGTPEEVAESVAFLASPQAGWITGVTLSVDGGRANASAR
jgi:NAD(P)-dependent dehydrogenase (short-subunit alcohol dehydrogenase family)